MTARGGAAIPGVLVAKTWSTDVGVAVGGQRSRGRGGEPARKSGSLSQCSASRNAYDLAVFPSVLHPLTVPVMRPVQRSMLPSTSTAELAEFFVGGLLQRLEDASAPDGGQPNEAGYQFVEGVREELIRSLRYSWLRVSGTTEMPQIDQCVGHQFHTVVPLPFRTRSATAAA